MILIIDNYDSFTYNLVQYIGSINKNLVVFRNDKITLDEISDMNPEKIVISPGPGTPENAGISIDIIKNFKKSKPILGICLGHQAIVVSLGGIVDRTDEIVHGKTSEITHKGSVLFRNIPSTFEATRYHSLVAIEKNFPDELSITARTKSGVVMAVEHKNYPVFGLQFHPESIMTKYGIKMIKNFLKVDNENSN